MQQKTTVVCFKCHTHTNPQHGKCDHCRKDWRNEIPKARRPRQMWFKFHPSGYVLQVVPQQVQ